MMNLVHLIVAWLKAIQVYDERPLLIQSKIEMEFEKCLCIGKEVEFVCQNVCSDTTRTAIVNLVCREPLYGASSAFE